MHTSMDPENDRAESEDVYLDAAEDGECLGHPAEDCGPEGEGCALGAVLYCDGSCR